MADDEELKLLLKLYEDALKTLLETTESWTEKTKLPESIPKLPNVPDDKTTDDSFKTFKKQRQQLEDHFLRHMNAIEKEQSCSLILQRVWKLRKHFKFHIKPTEGTEDAEKNKYTKHIQILDTIKELFPKDSIEKLKGDKNPSTCKGMEADATGEEANLSSPSREERIDVDDAKEVTSHKIQYEKDRETSKKEIERLKKQYKDSQQALEELTEKMIPIQEREQEYKATITGYEEKMKLPENKTKARNVSLEKDLKACKNEIKELKSELDRSNLKYQKAVKDTRQLEKQLHVQRPQTAPVHNSREMQAKIDNLKREMTFYMEQSQTLRNEKDSLMQRLSKVAGTKMKDNNPSIADLSDPNRPERLAEQFREIYDNAWTDLLDDLNDVMGESDAVGVQTIMDILQNIYNGCEEQIRKRMGTMLKCLGYTHDDMKKQYDGGKKGHDPTVKIIKDLIKNSVERILEAISKHVEENEKIDNIFKTVGKKSAQTFVSKCTEICIYMCVQDPPVVLDFSFKSGDTFNKDCLNPFTKTGEVIDFVVWPVMYLFKDGAMMSKGIAQGTKKSSTMGEDVEAAKDTKDGSMMSKEIAQRTIKSSKIVEDAEAGEYTKDGTMMSKGIAQRATKSSKSGEGAEAGKDMPNPGKERNQAAESDEHNKKSTIAEEDMVTSDDDNDVVTPSDEKDKSAQKQKSKKSEEHVMETKAEDVAKETTSNEALENERKTASKDKTEISESILQDKSKEVINTKL